MRNYIILLILNIFIFGHVHAAVYHIDPTAGSSGSGSALNPFSSWYELPSMQTGDDVYFKCGTTFYPENALTVHWEGTSSDPAVIGAYYMLEGVPVYSSDGSRPIISGSDFTVPSNLCLGDKNSWSALLQVKSKDYVHIQDLQIDRSGFRGLMITGNLDTGTNSAHFRVSNVFVNGSYTPGILIYKNRESYGVVENCEVTMAGASFGLLKNSSGEPCEKGWPVALAVLDCPYSYVTIRNNYVHENWAEGIGSGRVPCISSTAKSGYVTIEDNIIWNNRRVDIYIDRSEGNVVRNNIALGTDDEKFQNEFSDGRYWNQLGIWVNTESRNNGDTCSDNTNYNKVYNNLVAGHYGGIAVGSAFTSGSMENNLFYNNTLIANRYNFRTSLSAKLYGYTTDDLEFSNNIFYCPPGSICNSTDHIPSWLDSKITIRYNAWSENIPPNIEDPSNIVLSGNSFAVGFDWQHITESEIGAIIKKFRLLSGSNAIDTGKPLGSTFDEDFWGISRPQESGWDMGATEFYSESSQLLNGSFEWGSDGSWMLGDNCSVVNNADEAHDGDYSLRIDADGGWHSASQNIAMTAGHEYQIMGYLKSSDIVGNAPRIRFRWYDADDNRLGTHYFYGAFGTTDYELHSATIHAPANAARLEIYPYVYQWVASGSAWFDDISVDDLDAPPPPPDKLVANGDFESRIGTLWVMGSNCNIVNNYSEANSGTYALRIDADGGWHSASQNIDVTAGHEYEVMGYLKSSNIVGNGPRIRLRWYDADDNRLGTDYLHGAAGTSDYELRSATIVAPANAIRLEIYPYVYQWITSGSAWFDDISVDDLSE